MSWEKITFGELYKSPTRNGIYKEKSNHGSGVKIVNMGEIFAYDFIGSQDMQRIELTENELQNFRLEENDLLFARRSLVESGAGKASIVANLVEPTTFESSIIRVRLNAEICCPLFYLYWLRSLAGRAAISALVTGVNVKGIRGSELKDIKVDYPPIEIQRKISGILQEYDNLIENNQKQIKLLEEAAQRLYKEWFVDLRFPGHENTEIVDGVPEGWEKELVGNVIEKSYRSKQVMTADYLAEGKIPIIDQSREFIAGYTDDEETLVSFDKPIIVFGDHTRVLKYIQFPFAKGADGTQLIISKCGNMPQSLLYLSLLNVDLSNYHYARHFKYLKAEEIIIPNMEIATKFNCLVSPIFKKIQNLRDQIIGAQQARDRLLPKLMSGELEVSG